ncbi:tripartite tricarboxylate transporter substrate binding protein [Phreatobacter sp.]|uniref:Bug family tripartite tricarboxylate transporter substrate binding protein n=1 Tax=Phreatobacter sp. TaxID=1966341 RepID=UPI0025D2DF30|nr:tripartite tricarboxylate transporter substrate binding protein [Phreatobacter sp.]
MKPMVIFSLMAALMAVVQPTAVAAQDWPSRTVRLVVPYPPGGNVDVAARILGERLQQELGQPFIIENRAGAGGLIGSEAVAKAEPDGYTILIGANGPILFAPEMSARRAYEWRRDFIPVTTVTLTPLVLQVRANLPADTLAKFLALARTPQAPLKMASPGPGTTNHLISEVMQARLGINWTTVQYRGNAPATNDVIAGHMDFNLDQLSVALPFLKDGRTRALAITGAQRSPDLPDVPTFTELGYAEFDGQTFTGLMLPARTPEAIVARLHAAVVKVLGEPGVQARLRAIGTMAAPMSRADFQQYLEKEDRTWLPVIKRLEIRSN